MLWVSKSCNVILEFYFKQNSEEKNINIQQTLFFSFLKKTKPIKQKKIINISYLMMVQIKMRLLIFLALTRYGLACKYRIISQISIFNTNKMNISIHFMQNCIFRYFWYCIFIFLRPTYNLVRQVRWFVTWWFESIIISSDRNRTSSGRQLKKRDGSR